MTDEEAKINSLVQSVLKEFSVQFISEIIEDGYASIDNGKSMVHVAQKLAHQMVILKTPIEGGPKPSVKQKEEQKEELRVDYSKLSKKDDDYINQLIAKNRPKK